MSIVVKNNSRHDNTPRNDAFGRFGRTHLGQTHIQNLDYQHAENVLTTDPRPPIRLVPPITTAAIA